MSAPLLVFFAYVIGATPVSLWVSRFAYGKDLRTLGSGNLGATNTFRVLGWKAAVPVLALDVFKGFAPVWWFPQMADQSGTVWTVAYGAAAIVGHVFSFWVRFRGGKGVATSAGALTALAPVALLVGLTTWLVVLGLTRIVSVASISAAIVVPAAILATPGIEPVVKGFFGALGAFILWAHRSNIGRLRRGEEPRIGGGAHKGGRP